MLHPKARREGGERDEWCPSLHQLSFLGRTIEDTPEKATRKGLKIILECRNHQTNKRILELITDPCLRRLVYNLDGLAERDASVEKNTVEFRGHEGTMDPERITNWINVCVGLVEFADSVDPGEFNKFLWSHVDDEKDFTVIDLLKAIGRPAEAQCYAKRFQEHPELL